MWTDYELDDDGQLRRKKRSILPDGATMNVPMGFYDGRFVERFADGSVDETSPHRPGHRFADTDDEARLAAEQAYQDRSRRMSDAWKRKGEPQQEAKPAQTLAATQANAERAYADKCERMRNAWKQR